MEKNRIVRVTGPERVGTAFIAGNIGPHYQFAVTAAHVIETRSNGEIPAPHLIRVGVRPVEEVVTVPWHELQEHLGERARRWRENAISSSISINSRPDLSGLLIRRSIRMSKIEIADELVFDEKVTMLGYTDLELRAIPTEIEEIVPGSVGVPNESLVGMSGGPLVGRHDNAVRGIIVSGSPSDDSPWSYLVGADLLAAWLPLAEAKIRRAIRALMPRDNGPAQNPIPCAYHSD